MSLAVHPHCHTLVQQLNLHLAAVQPFLHLLVCPGAYFGLHNAEHLAVQPHQQLLRLHAALTLTGSLCVAIGLQVYMHLQAMSMPACNGVVGMVNDMHMSIFNNTFNNTLITACFATALNLPLLDAERLSAYP